MFGKKFWQSVTTLGLMILCIYIMKLIIAGEFSIYVHPRYSLFALITSAAGFVLLSIVFFTKQRTKKAEAQVKQSKVLNVIAAILLVTAVLLPPKTLSGIAVAKKSINTPAAVMSSQNGECPGDTGYDWTLSSLVYYLDKAPAHCFKGKQVRIVGTVVSTKDLTLPQGVSYVGRTTISCCAVDARTFALPVALGASQYVENTWLQVKGTLEIQSMSGGDYFVIKPTSITKVEKPDDNYYEYLGELPAKS